MKTTNGQGTTTYIEISGNTYPVREGIKALGGRWNPNEKVWRVPADRAQEAQRLVPPKTLTVKPKPSPCHGPYIMDFASRCLYTKEVMASINSTPEAQIAELEGMYNRDKPTNPARR